MKSPRISTKRSHTEASHRSALSERWVRESLSMPQEEREILDRLIHTLRSRGAYEVTRSQLLRAGIAALAGLQPRALEFAISRVERGRPGRKPV